MMKGLKVLWPYLALFAFWFVLFAVANCSTDKLRKENEQLREELAKQQQYVPLKRDTIRDTVEVVTQEIVEVEKIKHVLTAEDKALLNDLRIKVKELESMQTIGTVTHDTVYLEVADTAKGRLIYHDTWADFEYYDRKLRYAVKDSLAIFVKRQAKHRFLWWRWGTKGYEVKAVNFNPHSTIRYNTYVKRKN